MDLLPDDVLSSGVLRRLAPRCLAVSRSVCKEWRAVIDTHRLLRADLLPLSLYGIIFEEKHMPDYYRKLFRLPSPETRISLKFDDYMLPIGQKLMLDHCNGLLLLDDWVTNPATRQCVQLPPIPPPCCTGMEDFYMDECLVFDPMVSPHYEVFSIPCAPRLSSKFSDNTRFTERSEWPPSPYPIRVFSSRTRRWEERSFVRDQQGEAAAWTTIADMQSTLRHRYFVYWKGAIYVHCQNNSIMRLTLSNNRYGVIQWPTDDVVVRRDDLYMGKSKEGIYCVSLCVLWRRLRVWHLNESRGEMEWVLKNDVSLRPLCLPLTSFDQNGPWILEEFYHDRDPMDASSEEKFEWDTQNGIILEKEEYVEQEQWVELCFMGFHPCKDIAFLRSRDLTVVAYHLNSSKVQILGKLPVHSVGSPFLYTPCWMTEILENN